MTLTPAQLEERRQGITATDVAAIVNLHPYRSVIDVVADKRGAPGVDDLGPRARWGNLLEGPIRDDYAERHGVTVTVPGVLTHPKVPHHKATPDGLVWYRAAPQADRGLEIKTHTVWLRGGYGAPGSDEVPIHELIQCVWNMHVTGLDRWDLVAFIDGLPVDYCLERDAELEGDLVDAVDRFWRDVIVGGAEPDADGTDAYEEHLKAKFKAQGPGFRAAEGTLLETISTLRDVRSQLDALTKDEKRLEQLIKAFIGDHEGVEFPALGNRGKTERITYRKSKDGTKVDAGAVAADLQAALMLLKGAPVLDALADVALRWGDRFTIEGSKATYTGGDLMSFIKAIRELDPAKIFADHTTPTVGPRVFNCPRNW